MTASPQPKKITAIVLNSVSHDARVLKEAASLTKAGYEVTIIGLQDNKCPDRITHLDNGVIIHRVDMSSFIMSLRYAGTALTITCVGLLFLLVVLGTVFGVIDPTAILKGAIAWTIESIPIAFLATVSFLWNHGVTVVLFVMAAWLCTKGVDYMRASRAKRSSWQSQFDSGSHPSTPSPRSKPLFKRALGAGRRVWPWWKRRLALAYKKAAVNSTFVRKLDELTPDIVHCHDLTTLPIGGEYKKHHPSTRLVFDSHELYEEVANLSPAMKRYWQRVLSQHASAVDGFITVNQSIADELRTRYPVLPEPVVVCNAVELNGELPPYDGRLHEAAELPSDTNILLYQGGYATHRGLEMLVESAPQLPEGWVLVMMGWGKLEPHLQKIAGRFDPDGDKIRFIPPAPQAELQRWTSGASLGVIPYENTCMNHWFCSPNKLWEYPAAGVPILASPFPELSRIVIGEDVGILLGEHPDPGDLARRVAEVDGTRLADLKTNCSTFIQKDNWKVYADRILNLYDRLTPA